MNKIFVQNFNLNNEIWKLYSISKEESLNYFSISNKNNISENKLNLATSKINNCNYIELSNKIIYSILNDEKIEFLNIYDNIFYDVYNIFFTHNDSPIILYFCNKEDPFVIIQCHPYMEFKYIFYINKKEIINFSHSTSYPEGFCFPQIEKVLNFVNKNEILHIETKFKKYLFFGFINNIGHHLWNELSGLFYFLKNKDYHKKIHGIIIGHYDFFDMESYLINNYKFNLIKFNELFNTNIYNNCQINLNNIFPVFLNSFYIEKEISEIIDDNNYNQNYEEQKNILEISIDIRSNNRYLINQDIFYTKLIKKILCDYNNYFIKINFLGCFNTKSYIIDKNTNEEYIEQNKIFSKIIENFNGNKNIYFENFIGRDFFYIKKNVIKSKIFIHNFGTSISNLLNWIYKTKTICFGPKKSYGWTLIQYDILENHNVIFSPKEYIIFENELNDTYDINFDLYYEFLKNIISL